MAKGIVLFFEAKRGFGYIRVSETKEEFYFQRKHLLMEVKKGDGVTFEIGEDRHGLFAWNISIITGSSDSEQPNP